MTPGCNHANDVLVRVGMARFLECRQDEQIREQIRHQHGIALGLSTVSYLARKFVAYVQVVHQQSVTALRGANGVVHGLACWILAYGQDGEGDGFPFDVPYLDFYERMVQVHQMLDAAGPLEGKTRRGPLRELTQLRQILAPVVTGEQNAKLRQIVAETKRDRRVFERFRRALRICPWGGTNRRNDQGAPREMSASGHRRVLQDLRTSLGRRARRGGNSARACKIVVQHLEKY